jgi:hypothetical protein
MKIKSFFCLWFCLFIVNNYFASNSSQKEKEEVAEKLRQEIVNMEEELERDQSINQQIGRKSRSNILYRQYELAGNNKKGIQSNKNHMSVQSNDLSQKKDINNNSFKKEMQQKDKKFLSSASKSDYKKNEKNRENIVIDNAKTKKQEVKRKRFNNENIYIKDSNVKDFKSDMALNSGRNGSRYDVLNESEEKNTPIKNSSSKLEEVIDSDGEAVFVGKDEFLEKKQKKENEERKKTLFGVLRSHWKKTALIGALAAYGLTSFFNGSSSFDIDRIRSYE